MKGVVKIVGRDFLALGMVACLYTDGWFEIVGGDGAFSSHDVETTFGLWLMGPRIGKGAPLGLKLGECSVGITADSDAVLIDFQRGIASGDRGDFGGN